MSKVALVLVSFIEYYSSENARGQPKIYIGSSIGISSGPWFMNSCPAGFLQF